MLSRGVKRMEIVLWILIRATVKPTGGGANGNRFVLWIVKAFSIAKWLGSCGNRSRDTVECVGDEISPDPHFERFCARQLHGGFTAREFYLSSFLADESELECFA